MGIKVLIFVESRYKVNRKRIKSALSTAAATNGITGPAEVSVAIVGDRKMTALNKKFRNLDKTTNVLSFPLSEGEQTHLPSDTLRLGDIVISYPEIIRQASAENMLVDDKIEELLLHGLNHLMGIHH